MQVTAVEAQAVICEWCEEGAPFVRPHHRFPQLLVCEPCNVQRPARIEPEPKALKQTWIYFIQAGTGGPVKIGLADRPQRRLRQMQTGNHEPLRVVHKLRGTALDERRLHRRFRGLRVRGEWFDAEVLERVGGPRR